MIEQGWKEFALPSWGTWRTFLRALFALPFDPDDPSVFERHTGRSQPPTKAVREGWLVCGRKSGKSRIAALIAVFIALFRRHTLARGERGVAMILARDHNQATVMYMLMTMIGMETTIPTRPVADAGSSSCDPLLPALSNGDRVRDDGGRRRSGALRLWDCRGRAACPDALGARSAAAARAATPIGHAARRRMSGG